MKKSPKNRIIFFGIILAIMFFASTFFYSNPSYAAVSLPWSTTYNCTDWTQGQTLSCDGISTYGDWTTSAGSKEQITTAANYSVGGGGKGQRQWNGDGQNNNSGNTKITWTTVEPELWVRWYMRYEQGYTWATSGNSLSYDKWLYFDNTSNYHAIIEGWTYYDQNRILSNWDTNDVGTSGNGWDTIMSNGGTVNGHKTSDGQWHYYEVHIKMDTGNAQNGTGEIWIDGTLRYSKNSINYSGSSGATGWTSTLIGSNQAYPLNGRDVYVDFDDISVSTTGYIGPISGADSTAPTQPTNLSATVQSATEINLTWAASTDNVGVAGYNIYRDGVQSATSITTSYSDTGLTASTTYSYTVSAYDAAGNESAQSTAASATTQTPPPALKGDFNSDSKVNNLDFTSFKNAFKSIFNSIFDLNSDNTIDVKDLGVLMSGWLE